MAKKNLLRHRLISKRYYEHEQTLGWKVVIFGGDYRQTLLVIHNGKKDFINESLLNFTIWDCLEKYQLVQNVRARTGPTFCDYLLNIGNGKESVNSLGKIEIPPSFLIA